MLFVLREIAKNALTVIATLRKTAVLWNCLSVYLTAVCSFTDWLFEHTYILYIPYSSPTPPLTSVKIVSMVSKKCELVRCICSTFPHCPRKDFAFSFVFLKMSPQTVYKRVITNPLDLFVWCFYTMCFQMSPQIVCLSGCIVTLVAFVRLFPTVCFQMSPQMACSRGGIFTLVAFV